MMGIAVGTPGTPGTRSAQFEPVRPEQRVLKKFAEAFQVTLPAWSEHIISGGVGVVSAFTGSWSLAPGAYPCSGGQASCALQP